MKIRTALARAFVLDPSQLFRLFRKHSLLVHDHRPYFLPGVVCHKRIVPASHVSRTSSSGLGKTKGEERRREREREKFIQLTYHLRFRLQPLLHQAYSLRNGLDRDVLYLDPTPSLFRSRIREPTHPSCIQPQTCLQSWGAGTQTRASRQVRVSESLHVCRDPRTLRYAHS